MPQPPKTNEETCLRCGLLRTTCSEERWKAPLCNVGGHMRELHVFENKSPKTNGEIAKEIQPACTCGNVGFHVLLNSNGEPEQEQCQFCYEVSEPVQKAALEALNAKDRECDAKLAEREAEHHKCHEEMVDTIQKQGEELLKCDARVLGAFSLTGKHIIELNTIALSDKHFRQIVLKYLRNCLKTN